MVQNSSLSASDMRAARDSQRLQGAFTTKKQKKSIFLSASDVRARGSQRLQGVCGWRGVDGGMDACVCVSVSAWFSTQDM